MTKTANKFKIGKYRVASCIYLIARIDLIPNFSIEKVGSIDVIQFSWLFFSWETLLIKPK